MAMDCSRALGPRPAFVLEEASIDLIQRAMADGSLTARGLCEQYLQRIAMLNPTLHALIETNPDALAIADELDRERRTRGPRGPLHGIPLVIKDNIETADRMQTTAGSKVLDGVPVSKDAFVIERLRTAGAILLGKANLTEWAGGGGRNGYSTRGGQTLNPYDPLRTPLGSSSGSGVTASANLAVAGLGTETMGSILAPSSVLGVVGVKPTVGLVSRTGVVPVALSMDTVGPMTRNVADAAHVLNVLAAPDPEDMAASNQPARVDYAKALMPDLKGVRIGIVREPSAGEASRALFEQAIDDLRGLGAILVDGVMLPEVSASWFAEHLEVMFTELKAQLPTYLAARRSRATVRTLADVIEASTRDRVQLPPLELAQQKGDISGAPYQRAFAHIRQISRADGIDGVLRAHRLDALVSPAMEPAWTFAEDETLELFLPRGMLLTSDAGYPAVTLPMGYVTGLPVGILLFGTAWSDAVLLRCAYAYEQATHHRKPLAPRA
jgi:amidase